MVSWSRSAALASGASAAAPTNNADAMVAILIRRAMPAMVEGIESRNSSSLRQVRTDPTHPAPGAGLAPEDSSDESKNPSKRLTPQELSGVLQRHRRFVNQMPGGARANLSFHDLSGVDLTDCDLTG